MDKNKKKKEIFRVQRLWIDPSRILSRYILDDTRDNFWRDDTFEIVPLDSIDGIIVNHD